MGSLEREICFPKIGESALAKIGAGGKPLVGDSLRTFGPHEKNLSTTRELGHETDSDGVEISGVR